jgi:hypothetical protein
MREKVATRKQRLAALSADSSSQDHHEVFLERSRRADRYRLHTALVWPENELYQYDPSSGLPGKDNAEELVRHQLV